MSISDNKLVPVLNVPAVAKKVVRGNAGTLEACAGIETVVQRLIAVQARYFGPCGQ